MSLFYTAQKVLRFKQRMLSKMTLVLRMIVIDEYDRPLLALCPKYAAVQALQAVILVRNVVKHKWR